MDDSRRTCVRWCSFEGIRGLDRILKRDQILDGKGKAFSLPLSRHEGNGWQADPCNIVLFGAPGTGKSTLALDMAAELRTVSNAMVDDGRGGRKWESCAGTQVPEPCTVLYYGLEQSPESLERRFRMLAQGPGKRVGAIPIIDVPGRDDGPSNWAERYGKAVHGSDMCLPNLVLFPRLSPRRLEDTGEPPDDGADHTSIFWRRYGEIRHLIETLQEREAEVNRQTVSPLPCNRWRVLFTEGPKEPAANADAEPGTSASAGRGIMPAMPPLGMVVIDSLSMLGDKPVTRYLVDQLFALFTEKNVVGLFVVEERNGRLPEADSAPSVPSDVCFSADVVMRLGWMEWEGYAQRTLEVTKSRHSPTTYGRQWIKVRDQGVEVYPSLHNWYTYLHSAKRAADATAPATRDSQLGLGDLGPVLPARNAQPPSVVTLVAGSNDTNKASLAARYAAQAGKGRSLLVSFAESPDFGNQATRHGSEWFADRGSDTDERGWVEGLALPANKGVFSCITATGTTGVNPKGYQLWLAPGYLLSEELLWFVDERLAAIEAEADKDAAKAISRVIFMDVGHIATGFPALARQILNGTSNFFPVLRRLLEHHRVDGLFVCSTDDRRHNLVPLLKPLAHHSIELRYEDPLDGHAASALPNVDAATRLSHPIHAVVSGCWVLERRHLLARPDWTDVTSIPIA